MLNDTYLQRLEIPNMLTQEQKDTRKKWIEALRSKTYTQGVGALKSNGKHCVLGVLCEIIDPSDWHDYGHPSGRLRFGPDNGYLSSVLMPPQSVREAVGFTDIDTCAFSE